MTHFLTLDEVLAIHAHQVERYGGRPGIRDLALLESALAMPRAAFNNDDLHPSLHEKAAAYLFHLVKNHPFFDGNKRAGLAACLVFVQINGIETRSTDDELVEVVVAVAEGRALKADLAVFLSRHSIPPSQ